MGSIPVRVIFIKIGTCCFSAYYIDIVNYLIYIHVVKNTLMHAHTCICMYIVLLIHNTHILINIYFSIEDDNFVNAVKKQKRKAEEAGTDLTDVIQGQYYQKMLPKHNGADMNLTLTLNTGLYIILLLNYIYTKAIKLVHMYFKFLCRGSKASYFKSCTSIYSVHVFKDKFK